MTTEHWLTIALFGLSVVFGVVGFFLVMTLKDIKLQLSSLNEFMSDSRTQMATIMERQSNHGQRLERQTERLADFQKEMHSHAVALGQIALQQEKQK